MKKFISAIFVIIIMMIFFSVVGVAGCQRREGDLSHNSGSNNADINTGDSNVICSSTGDSSNEDIANGDIDSGNTDSSGGICVADDMYRYEQLAEEEVNELPLQYPFLRDLWIEDGTRVWHLEKNTLLALIIKGDFETEDNYFLLTVTIEYDKNFIFSSRHSYDNLDGHVENGTYEITYRTKSKPYDGWYEYLILLKTADDQKIYIRVECMEDDITYLLENMF